MPKFRVFCKIIASDDIMTEDGKRTWSHEDCVKYYREVGLLLNPSHGDTESTELMVDTDAKTVTVIDHRNLK